MADGEWQNLVNPYYSSGIVMKGISAIKQGLCLILTRNSGVTTMRIEIEQSARLCPEGMPMANQLSFVIDFR